MGQRAFEFKRHILMNSAFRLDCLIRALEMQSSIRPFRWKNVHMPGAVHVFFGGVVPLLPLAALYSKQLARDLNLVCYLRLHAKFSVALLRAKILDLGLHYAETL